MADVDHQRPEANNIHLLTISEVLARLSLGRSTFYQLVKDRKIPLRKVGGASRVRSDDLHRYIEDLPRLDTSEREVW